MPLTGVEVSPGVGRNILTRTVTIGGEPADIQQVQLLLSGDTGADQTLMLGQAPKALSLPIAIASDQLPLPFTGTITGGTVDVATLPPVNVATMPPVAITGAVTVTAVALDIRSLTSARDAITAFQGGAPWTVGQSGVWTVGLSAGAAVTVSGSVAHDGVGTGVNPSLIGGYAAPTAPAAVSTAGDAVRAWLDMHGALVNRQKPSSTSVTSSVAGSASSVALLAANASRQGATVHNDSTVALYLKLGTPASLTDFTVKMAADSYYEVPFNYTGAIAGIWASAAGNARVTELTA